jgi:hypothetical protein
VYSSGFRSLLRGRASPAVAALFVVALFVGSSLLVGVMTGPLASSATSRTNAAISAQETLAPTPPAAVHAPGTPPPHLTGEFFENNTTFADLRGNETVCESNATTDVGSSPSPPYTFYYNETFIENSCFRGAQNPTTLSLGGNTIGIGYSVISNQSMVGCANVPDVETSQVAFQVSKDGGATYGAPTWIGNATCAYLQALEPSFAVSTDHEIYGVFVEANMGSVTTNTTTNVSVVNVTTAAQFDNRTDDALAFTESSLAGTHFAVPVTLKAAGIGNIARPVIAAFGKTIYVVYENLNNNSSITLADPGAYPARTFSPISLELLTSINGGSTWTGPTTLPGMNASAGYTSMSPSIAVNSAGEVAVAYDTNRSCFESFGGICDAYGDNVVVSTTVTNGTSWVGPTQVSPNASGEYQCMGYDAPFMAGGECYNSFYQWGPTTSVAWSTSSLSTLFVAWSGTYSVYNASDVSYFYGTSAVYSGASTNGGSTWGDATVALSSATTYPDDQVFYYGPVINDHAGWVYVSYAEQNWTYCYGSCAPGTIGTNHWLATSLNGLAWMANVTLLFNTAGSLEEGPYVYNAFVGYTASMAFSTGGPVVTFSEPANFMESYYEPVDQETIVGSNIYFNLTEVENFTGTADLTTVFVWSGNTTVVNFTETGLPAGTRWNFTIGTAGFSTTHPTIEVTNVPRGPGLKVSVPTIPDAYWTQWAGAFSTNSTPSFAGPTNVTIHFTIEYGISFSQQPTTMPLFYLDFEYNDTEYEYEYDAACPLCLFTEPVFPWYFPVGTVITLVPDDIEASYPISYWTGTGNGSSTNFGNATSFTVDGIINETAWGGAFGAYTMTFTPEGLPMGTAFHFTFDGTAYSGTSPANVTVSNVITGAYSVSGIVAPGSAGYEYFGQVPGGDEIYVPATPVVVLNYSYALVDTSAAPGIVTFHALGLATGDSWQISFNGTPYSGDTPWINVTTRPGTFAVSAAPVQAALNDTAQYSPSGLSASLTISLGSSYAVQYDPTYRVVVVAAAGGTTDATGSHWLAPGATATYAARANPNYAFLGWTGTGTGSYTGSALNASVTVGGPITESANFVALPVDRFNLTVTQSGLPSTIPWTVNLDGVGYTGSGPQMVISNLYPCNSAGGSYTVGVPYAYLNGTSGIRYVASGVPSTICTSGTTQLSLTFAEEFLVTPVSTGGGTAAVEANGVPQSTATWVTAGATAGIEASPEAGYTFAGWLGEGAGSYTGPNADSSLTPTGPITEVATFAAILPIPTPLYSVSFHAGSGLASGTPWSVVFNGTAYASTTSWINVSGFAAGTYTLTVPTTYSSDRLTQFAPSVTSTSITVAGNLTAGQAETVTFSAAYYVNIESTTGGTVSTPTSGFVPSGKSITLNATPNAGYSFIGWTGTGVSSYSGPTASQPVTVSAPIVEVAGFAPIPATTTSNSGNGPNSTPLVIGLAVVGLVVGLAVGYVVFRKRGGASSGGSA